MIRVGFASIFVLGTLAATTPSHAQTGGEPPPPPPPAPPSVAPAPAPAPTAPLPPPQGQPQQPGAPQPYGPAPQPYGSPQPYGPAPQPYGAPAAPPAYGANAGATVTPNAAPRGWGGTSVAPAETPPASDSELARKWRESSLQLQNGITGSTGLLRVSQAGSAAPGTFRFSLLSSFFSGSGVLCNSQSICPSLSGEDVAQSDELDAVSAKLGLSATILPFLEGYFGFHNRSVSNSRGRPKLLELLGDMNLGVKAFMPPAPNQLFSFGGEAELWLLMGSGFVGPDGGGTSFALRALGTIDPNNRLDPKERIPLRGHLNLGYKFDNSAKLVRDLENTDPPAGRGGNISRIERFGLGINRVDFFQVALGAEYVHPVVRPFLEWTLDAPLNRQSYTCNIDDAALQGDYCLKVKQGIGIAPSRLTLGARLFPWEGRGLSVLGAIDIGTSGTSTFIDETAPELPWNLWFGLAYAVDTEPPKPVIQQVEAKTAPVAAPRTEYFIQGTVFEKGTDQTVPNPEARYDGRPLTGMIGDANGRFRSASLTPGTYTLAVSAQGYRDGQCTITIQPAAPTPLPAAPGTPALPQPITPGAPPPQQGEVVVPVRCELESLPKLGAIAGSLLDGETNQAVANARIRATDRKNRELELPGDASGAFRITNIPPGRIKLAIDAPGYFQTATELDVKALEELQTRIVLNKRPVQPNVLVQGNEVKLRKQVHFETDSAAILPDSMALLEEIADVLKSRTEIRTIEVQGHTDNTGTPPHNLRLSQDRAQAVVDALLRLGVDPGRLSAKGYGQEKPVGPNTTEPLRARNRRVQLMIQK